VGALPILQEIAGYGIKLGMTWEYIGNGFPSGYSSPNVSSIARSDAPGDRWLYLSAIRVEECPNTSATTSLGAPSIVR